MKVIPAVVAEQNQQPRPYLSISALERTVCRCATTCMPSAVGLRTQKRAQDKSLPASFPCWLKGE